MADQPPEPPAGRGRALLLALQKKRAGTLSTVQSNLSTSLSLQEACPFSDAAAAQAAAAAAASGAGAPAPAAPSGAGNAIKNN